MNKKSQPSTAPPPTKAEARTRAGPKTNAAKDEGRTRNFSKILQEHGVPRASRCSKRGDCTNAAKEGFPIRTNRSFREDTPPNGNGTTTASPPNTTSATTAAGPSTDAHTPKTSAGPQNSSLPPTQRFPDAASPAPRAIATRSRPHDPWCPSHESPETPPAPSIAHSPPADYTHKTRSNCASRSPRATPFRQ